MIEKMKKKKKNMLFKGVVSQLSFLYIINNINILILSIKPMRHVEPNVSEKLLANEKITASCQRNMCRKNYIKRCKQQK